MKNSKNLKAANYGAWVGGTWTIVKAYKKENAIKRYLELGAEQDVNPKKVKDITGATPVDCIVEIGENKYEVQYQGH